jgi:large subunit ribosomal protein L3
MKGMRGPGHMGNARATIRNLRVVQVSSEENTLLIQGAVPGPQGSYVIVYKAKAPHK